MEELIRELKELNEGNKTASEIISELEENND